MFLSGFSSALDGSENLPKRNTIPLTPDDIVREQVNKHRPSMGSTIPSDIEHRLGTTHAAGKYHFTQEPFLIEGANKILEFGSRVGKFFFALSKEGLVSLYPFCSDWSTITSKSQSRLVDLAKHPYFDAVFNLPFSTIILEITGIDNIRPFDSPNNDFSEHEEQFEELTEYLYTRFSDRSVTFIFQNWEGDWLFNGAAGLTEWNQQMMDDLPRRVDYYTRWFSARQRGVEKARKRFADAQCKVMNAVEVNRVLTLLEGTPTLTELVLPNVAPDLISWSSWDGMNSAVDLWHGIEIIKHFMKHSGFLSKPTVMLGEIGNPEQERTKEEIIDFWDRSMAVCFALDIPYILHWEIFCNEPTEQARKTVPQDGVYTAEDMRGFWLYLPDGSLSHSGQFLRNLLHKVK